MFVKLFDPPQVNPLSTHSVFDWLPNYLSIYIRSRTGARRDSGSTPQRQAEGQGSGVRVVLGLTKTSAMLQRGAAALLPARAPAVKAMTRSSALECCAPRVRVGGLV